MSSDEIDIAGGHSSKPNLSAKEAAVYLGVSERHLWTQTKARRIPHVKIGGRVLYPVKELDAWLEDRAAKSVK
jgi:excisionase family DNA binding protein